MHPSSTCLDETSIKTTAGTWDQVPALWFRPDLTYIDYKHPHHLQFLLHALSVEINDLICWLVVLHFVYIYDAHTACEEHGEQRNVETSEYSKIMLPALLVLVLDENFQSTRLTRSTDHGNVFSRHSWSMCRSLLSMIARLDLWMTKHLNNLRYMSQKWFWPRYNTTS